MDVYKNQRTVEKIVKTVVCDGLRIDLTKDEVGTLLDALSFLAGDAAYREAHGERPPAQKMWEAIDKFGRDM